MNTNHKKWHQVFFAYLSCPPDCAVASCLVAGERVGAVRWVSEGQGTQMLQWSGFVSAQETFVELAAESAGTARKFCFVKNNASLVANGKWYKAYLTSVYNVNKVLYFFFSLVPQLFFKVYLTNKTHTSVLNFRKKDLEQMKDPLHSILLRRNKKASRQVSQNVPFRRTDPHLEEETDKIS